MKLALLVLLSAAVAAQQSSSSIDPAKLEQLRRMSPEERRRLEIKLHELKALPSAERARLNDNLRKIKAMPPEELKKLREKAQTLSEAERKEYADLAGGFFRWAQRMGYAEGFPRGQFFHWLKNEKPGEIAEIRAMEPGPGSPRVDRFLKLFHEFRGVALSRYEKHLKQHACGEPGALEGLREMSASAFWPRLSELVRACQPPKKAK